MKNWTALETLFTSVSSFGLPKTKDITMSLGLINIPKCVNSHVSQLGQQQIEHMAQILEQSDFVRANKIQLVAHSPLIRARETCRGLLQCMAPDLKPDHVERVLELDLLLEKTPAEWIPGNLGSLIKRLRAFEEWVAEQPETVIALVGHSQFFKALFELDYKFGNCDVMAVEFNANGGSSPGDRKWSDLKEFHLCGIITPCKWRQKQTMILHVAQGCCTASEKR